MEGIVAYADVVRGERRYVKKGTILRNLYQPNYESYFVFRMYSGNDALGIWVIKTDKGIKVKWSSRFPKDDIQNDREHFPIVGHLDLDSLIVSHVLNEVSRYEKERNVSELQVLSQIEAQLPSRNGVRRISLL